MERHPLLTSGILNMSDEVKPERKRARPIQSEAFRAARKAFVERHKSKEDRQLAHHIYDMYLSHSTVSRIFNEEDHEFAVGIQDLFMNLMSNRLDAYFYYKIADLINQDSDDLKKFIKKYCGCYTYFRYFDENGDSAYSNSTFNAKYVSGNIRIYAAGGIPVFSHWSHNYDQEDPEHEGIIFLAGSRIFMLGYRNKILRLAIAEIPENPEREPIHGAILSITTKYKIPFAARFVMILDTNVELMELLQPGCNGTPGDSGKNYFADLTETGVFIMRGTPKKY